MLILKSKHDKAIFELQFKYAILLGEWNSLVEKINRKGGEQFLYGDVKKQFSQEEIKTLIALCHPDKHNQKESAVKITQKLLEMRE